MKASSINTQHSGKHQASRFKVARQWGSANGDQYPEPKPIGFVLNDGANGDANGQHAFDLEERTAKFGEAVVLLSKKIPCNPTNNRLIDQLVGAGTSVGANYCEATEALSKKDFRYSISRCVKEAKETKYFLRMIAASEPDLAGRLRELYREANEIHLIFASIYRKG